MTDESHSPSAGMTVSSGDGLSKVIQCGLQPHESVRGNVAIDFPTKPWNGDLHLLIENQLKSPATPK